MGVVGSNSLIDLFFCYTTGRRAPRMSDDYGSTRPSKAKVEVQLIPVVSLQRSADFVESPQVVEALVHRLMHLIGHNQVLPVLADELSFQVL